MQPITPEQIQTLVKKAIPDASVAVEDLTGTRDHYKIIVVTATFEGKTLIERHQMVNEALKEPLKGPIHALTMETYTPTQWQKKIQVLEQQAPKDIEF